MSRSDRELAEVRELVLSVGIPLIGESAPFLNLLRCVDRVATRSAATVLIRGETGTGKELIARAIHYLGARRDFPFVPVNCGALPESLVENELFGHRSGAFTGATQEATGLVRLADRGTLFLDEVDSLPAKAQVALLRFLQDGHFRPLGAVKEEQANVRIVAASNRSLEDEVRAGRFRQDLFYRLNLIVLEVPPLRVRTGDVQVLSMHFMRQCSERYRTPPKILHRNTLTWFNEYRWPGNIRELENLIHREFLMCEEECVIACTGPAYIDERGTTASVDGIDPEPSLMPYARARMRAIEEFDRAYLENLLSQAGGNVSRAARLAGKERRALGKLIKRYSVVPASFRTGAAPEN